MKKYRLLTAFLLFFPLLFGKSNTPRLYSLTVKVEGLRNSDGVVQFALYNKDGSLPDEKFKSWYRIGTSEIENNRAFYIFTDLPKGDYAVNILHDENRNGKIDKGLILPKEGIGFSNYQKIGLSNKPRFSKASFPLETDRTIYIKIIYL